MGPKVTIDSAGLVNKGLEVIEAHHLFGVPAERLDVVVHPQSVVHGLVSFADGSVTAGLALPDMRVPIAHCLTYPRRIESGARKLDLAAVGTLTFEVPDLARFPGLRVAIAALKTGGPACPPCSTPPTRSPWRPSWHGGSASPTSCASWKRPARRPWPRGWPRPRPTSAEALAVDHVARERAAALLH